MTGKVYKYLGPRARGKVFESAHQVTLRCSLPKEFNDPYELFLSINLNENPERLAFYNDVIGELPQVPTTCFSRSPAIIPMWAHYAQNLEGFAIEFDEARISSQYPDAGFGDVDYRDDADPELNDALALAYETCKPRHTFFLRRGVFSAA